MTLWEVVVQEMLVSSELHTSAIRFSESNFVDTRLVRIVRLPLEYTSGSYQMRRMMLGTLEHGSKCKTLATAMCEV